MAQKSGDSKNLKGKALTAAEKYDSINKLMKERNLDAYLIPSADSHNSENPTEHDQRRKYISNFTGSAGVALVTPTRGYLWTDGRYFIQAEEQLDSAIWELMKSGTENVLTVSDWIVENNDVKRLGFDAFTVSAEFRNSLDKKMKLKGKTFEMVSCDKNLVDIVWAQEPSSSPNRQPELPFHKINYLPVEFTGEFTVDKILKIRNDMKNDLIPLDVLCLTDTADVAWLTNLRGGDFQWDGTFRSFCLITHNDFLLYCDATKLTSDASKSLADSSVTTRPYSTMGPDIKAISESNKDFKFGFDSSICLGFYECVFNKENIVMKTNPVENRKAIKNKAELEAFRKAHIHDGIALSRYLFWLETKAADGSLWNETEKTSSDVLDAMRLKLEHCIKLSFPTISALGPNAAKAHYETAYETAKRMQPDLYLVDSGGHYSGATTDVTRTIHLGEPGQFQKECWTRVLKGHINLRKAIFPKGTKGPQLDSFARQFLWQNGLDYKHGTGHGVGSQLNVHEGPHGISPSMKEPVSTTSLTVGMITSNEPGYYLENQFGVRIENLVEVVSHVCHSEAENATCMMAFEDLTLAPLQKLMMDFSILTKEELLYINSYHQKVFETLTKYLNKEEDKEFYDWLCKATSPIETN